VDLYRYYDAPDELIGYNQRQRLYLLPDRIVGRAKCNAQVHLPYNLTAQEHQSLAASPHWALQYARLTNRRFPEVEDQIAQDPGWAYNYASDVIDGPWPPGEPAIATSPYISYLYARYAIQGPFPLGEKAIAQDPELMLDYQDFVKRQKQASKDDDWDD
jgi:hypothetical protein